MARVTSVIGETISGNVRGLVYVKRNGATYVRVMPEKRKAGEWSPDQKTNRHRFKYISLYATRHKKLVIDPIWKKHAKQLHRIGRNMFLEANNGAFGPYGQVEDPEKLHFSTGPLPLPNLIRAELDTETHQTISVRWTDQLAEEQYDNDCLMAITYLQEPITIVNTGFTRKDGKATIAYPNPLGGEVYLFLFFWNPTLDIYSPDHVSIIKRT